MEFFTIPSPFDGLMLSAALSQPAGTPKGIVQFSHGMAEHKERYFDFMQFLSANGYLCVIHDHRGHGESVRSAETLGHFYSEYITAVVEDLFAVTRYVKGRFPGLPVNLFSHSMGTLVARSYLKKHDGELEKLVLCGPPTENPAAAAGLVMAKLSKPFHKENAPNHFLNSIAFKGYNRDYPVENAWLSANPENVAAYNSDPLCGYTFTTNGFINLLTLQKEAFNRGNWSPANPALPIFVIAGQDDPVIGSEEKFTALLDFLHRVGYKNTAHRLYPGKRHEILNEYGKTEVYQDVLAFLNKAGT